MKGQQLFHTFLPGVTAAVLTSQPAWAGTVKVDRVQLTSSPNVVTSTYSQTLVADATNFQLNDPVGNKFTTLVPTNNWNLRNVKRLSDRTLPAIAIGNNSSFKAQILRENQSRFFHLTSTSYISQQPDLKKSPESNQIQNNLATTGEKLERKVVSSSRRKLSLIEQRNLLLSASQPVITPKKNPQAQLQAALSPTTTNLGSAKLLAIPNCSEGGNNSTSSGYLLLKSGSCQTATTAKDLLAQTPATVNPTPGSAVQIPTAPATVNPTPGSAVQIPTVPATGTPTPGVTVPVTAPATGTQTPSGTVQVPENLTPNPNPLQFPTKPEEVTIQGNQPITLAQALELAKRSNRQLQVSQLELERSRAALREAQAALFPTVGVSADVTRQRTVSETYNVKVQQQGQEGLPPAFREQIDPAPSTTNFNGQAQLSYDIYTSGSRQANIRAAEEQVRFNELAVENQAEEIRLTVSTDYYNLQQRDEQVRIAQSAVANAQASLRDAEALERAGVGTRFDVLRSQVNLANSQQDLTNAISLQQIARRQLAARLSLPQLVNITAADPVRLAGLWNQTLEQSIILALQNRPDLQQQLAQRNINEQQRRQALAALGPQVSLIASYQLFDQFNDNISVADGYSVGVRATLNLFDGGAARARAAQARANIAIAETNFAEQRNQIRFQVEQAFSTQQSSLENVQTANTALEQAREALRLARLRFQAGVGTQTDVINSENDLTRAEGNRITAILDYNRALAQLQRAVTLRAFR
ncbi:MULTISPECIES: TolC family protein [unclassified Tolypothrix]|uniref:TolC family protein n=1 Tax=unclassified Tolypothrix TaxID=2649714 RepID=UPI0005EAC5C9|nr:MULTISPECIES: TolC family protein [unclassified Tolypothrix]BAY92108.1 outer membrane efflux protein [Microchaete diplosiphon NIES-3275]EKF04677.1 putative outer membrane efflux protein [Tolypothrix sp. PCC 7601]MBE9085993.1 TolC family protein [Tolypothrix sp. LEGE 11397]UYD26090.1 TolC family protein [Tolypothrix sp. PCC 7712]UYD31671.1 TolC family protein [Tolypothrix sp. PCC 7601]